MNFLKSILSDDPEATNPQNPNDSESSSAWSFGDLIQTIATRSESVISTYRKDLQEFSAGLQTETQLVRDAVKDLPSSLALKSTAVFSSDKTGESNRKRYSWLETQLNLIGNDEATFVEEPEEVEEFRKWRSGFVLEDKSDEIEDLIGEKGPLEGVYIRSVPSLVDDETFWFRYFYRVDKLKVQEKVRANLVKRPIVVDDDEEELSWDVDDDTDEKVKNVSLNEDTFKKEDAFNAAEISKSEDIHLSNKGSEDVSTEEVKPEGCVQQKNEEQEEDMGWDEIENIASDDEKKLSGTTGGSGSPDRAELRKRLSVADDEDEDLSWDIEDDDEPVKA